MKGKSVKVEKKKMLIGVMVVCAMLTMTASVCLANYNFDGYPVETRTNGTVNGGVFIGYEPWAGTTTLSGSFDVPPGTVKWVRLYTGIWGGKPEYAGWVNVTFNGDYTSNGLGPIHLRGENDNNPNVWCSGCGKHWMFYNVTNLTEPGCTNTATTSKINSTAGDFDGRVYGIVLVVVYEDGSNKVQYWINDGSDGLNYVTPHNESTTYFNGSVDTANISRARLTAVHLTGYYPSCDRCLRFNDHSLDTSMIDSDTFELNSWDVKSCIAPSGNNASYSRGDDTYVNVCNAILTVEHICGDVDGDGEITMGDVGLLWPHVFYPAEYPIDKWAGDVDGDGEITMGDVGLLWPHVFYPTEYPLNCTT